MRGTLLAVPALALLVGCSSVTKDIEVDAIADPSVDFSRYQTYSSVSAAVLINDPAAQWEAPGFDPVTEVKNQVDAALQERGMTENDTDPDLLVGFGVGLDMEALGLMDDPNSDSKLLQNVPQAGLVLLLADSETAYVSWIGMATGEVQENPDDDTVKKRVEYAVSEMIKKLPN
jgi:hypothetical protein